jgi:hypothetical protein
MSTFNVHEWNRKRYLSEEVNEEYTMANFRTINDFMTSMASPGGIEAFYKLPTQTKAELFRFYAEELEDDRF